MVAIRPGDRIRVITADGVELPRVAVTGPVDGDDFRVVWVCLEDDWPANGGPVSHDRTMAWPIEAVLST
jgi:hypothetical protein